MRIKRDTKNAPRFIFQNDPMEKITPYSANGGYIHSLTGRIWKDIFKQPSLQKGQFVIYGDMAYIVDSIIGPSNSNMADCSISRICLKKETITSFKEANRIYHEEKKKKEEIKNPSKPKPLPISKTAKFAVYLKQDGGCDYTIGCGLRLIYLEANNKKDAVKEARSAIKDFNSEDRIRSAMLFELSDRCELVGNKNIKAFLDPKKEKAVWGLWHGSLPQEE